MGNSLGCDALSFAKGKCTAVVRSLETQLNNWTEENKVAIENLIDYLKTLDRALIKSGGDTEKEEGESQDIIFDGNTIVYFDNDFELYIRKRKKAIGVIPLEKFDKPQHQKIGFNEVARLGVQNDLLNRLCCTFLVASFANNSKSQRTIQLVSYANAKLKSILSEAVGVKNSPQEEVVKRASALLLCIVSPTNFDYGGRAAFQEEQGYRTEFKHSFVESDTTDIDSSKKFKYRKMLCDIFNLISASCRHVQNSPLDECEIQTYPYRICTNCIDKVRRIFFYGYKFAAFSRTKIKFKSDKYSSAATSGQFCGPDDVCYDCFSRILGADWDMILVPEKASKY